MIVFGIDDGILSAALAVRKRTGPQEIGQPARRKGTLSLCMIVKNEEQNLARCLMSVKPVADEMIVIDTGSSDRTKDIALAFGAKVYDFPWTGDFAGARNCSLSHATGGWILVLDADEVISPLDSAELSRMISRRNTQSAAYSFVTRNYVIPVSTTGWTANDGKYAREEAGTGWFPSVKVRLFPNDRRIGFVNPVHELVEPSLKNAGIPIKACSIPIHHYGKLDEEKDARKGEHYYLLGKKKIEETGENADALRELAIQAGGLKKHDEAIELWQKLLKLEPDSSLAYLNMSSLYLELDRYDNALTTSRKAFELDPARKEAAYNYSLCQLYAGNGMEAIAVLESLTKKEPAYPSARVLLAVAHCCTGNREKGFGLLTELQKMEFGFADSICKFARKLVAAGRPDYAALMLDASIASGNVSADIFSLREECGKVTPVHD
jgi:glycosyltransferase involved in cell wall biosynthesis